MTLWFGERDDENLEPSPSASTQMHRLAAIMRTIPGVAAYIEGLEQHNFGRHRGMKPGDLLADGAALTAWRNALQQSSAPPT